MAVVADQVVIDLIARTDKLEAGLKRAGTAMDGIGNRARDLTGLFAGFLGLQTAQQLLGFAESAKKVEAQLRLATREFGDFNKAQEDAQRIAIASRSGIEATTGLYGNFIRAAQATGRSQEEAARATETFAKALKIGGSGAVEAEQATRQFNQALQSGVLRGDELNSVFEASPRVIKLLADSLGVSIGQIRALAEEGKLTSDVLFRALTERKFTAGLEAEFKSLPVTTGDALKQLENAAINVFGKFDKGGQFSTALANFISDGAAGFSDLEKNATEFGIQVGAALAGLRAAFDPFKDGGSQAIDFLRSKFLGLRDEIAQVLGFIDQIRNAGRAGLISSEAFNNTRIAGTRIGDTAFKVSAPGPRSNSRGEFLNAYNAREAYSRDRIRSQEINDRFGFDPATLTFKRATASPSAPVSPRGGGSNRKPAAGGGAKKQASESAAANRELEQSLNQLQAAYDPAAAAADRYAEEVKKIDALQSSRKISDADAFVYKFRASAEFAQATRKAIEDTAGLMRDMNPFEGGQASLRASIDDADARRDAGLEANEAIAEDMRRRTESQVFFLADVFEAGFTGGSKGIWKMFEREGLRALSVLLAKFVVLQAVQGGGILGNLAEAGTFALGGVFGGARASGGPVSAGRQYLVGEKGPEIVAMGAAGTVIPNSVISKAARPNSGGVTVLQTIAVDAKGAVMNDQFASMILARAGQDSANIAQLAMRQGQAGIMHAISRPRTPGSAR